MLSYPLRGGLALCWASLTLLSCDLDRSRPASERAIDSAPRLQAIEVVRRHQETGVAELIAVTDVAFHQGVWGEGRVLLIDPKTRTVEGVHYTAQANPHALEALEGGFLTLQGGALSLDGARPLSTHSGLTWHPVSDPLGGAQGRSWLSDPLEVGYPVSVIKSPWLSVEAEEAPPFVMSSGVSGLLWSAAEGWLEPSRSLRPAEATPIRYAPSGQLSLGALQRWGAQLLVVDFNTDRLSSLSSDGQIAPCQPELGRFPEVMEGAQTPVVSGDRLFVSFGLSGQLIELDLTEVSWEDEACEVSALSYSPPLGAVPNDLIVTETSLYVLHSGEQDVWVYDRSSRGLSHKWKLPDDSHPWQMTLARLDEGERLLITGWVSGEVLSLDPRSGVVERLIGPELLSAPPPSACVRATQLEGGRAIELSEEPLTFTWPTPTEQLSEASPLFFMIESAPQLAITLSGEEAELLVELQREEGGAWEPLEPVTLTSLPSTQGSSERAPRLLNAEKVALANPEYQFELEVEEPCARFIPSPKTLRLRVPKLASAGRPGRSLVGARVRVISAEGKVTLEDTVYRWW